MKKDYPEQREDWLHVEYFAKLSKKENPHGFICILCYKTHSPKNCSSSKIKTTTPTQETRTTDSLEWAKHASDGEWYGD